MAWSKSSNIRRRWAILLPVWNSVIMFTVDNVCCVSWTHWLPKTFTELNIAVGISFSFVADISDIILDGNCHMLIYIVWSNISLYSMVPKLCFLELITLRRVIFKTHVKLFSIWNRKSCIGFSVFTMNLTILNEFTDLQCERGVVTSNYRELGFKIILNQYTWHAAWHRLRTRQVWRYTYRLLMSSSRIVVKHEIIVWDNGECPATILLRLCSISSP